MAKHCHVHFRVTCLGTLRGFSNRTRRSIKREKMWKDSLSGHVSGILFFMSYQMTHSRCHIPILYHPSARVLFPRFPSIPEDSRHPTNVWMSEINLPLADSVSNSYSLSEGIQSCLFICQKRDQNYGKKEIRELLSPEKKKIIISRFSHLYLYFTCVIFTSGRENIFISDKKRKIQEKEMKVKPCGKQAEGEIIRHILIAPFFNWIPTVTLLSTWLIHVISEFVSRCSIFWFQNISFSSKKADGNEKNFKLQIRVLITFS